MLNITPYNIHFQFNLGCNRKSSIEQVKIMIFTNPQ